MGSPWTDEQKQEVIDKYVESDPTPENTTEIVQELAEEYDKTPNGVMQVLAKAKVYVKKTPPVSSGSSTSTGKATATVSRVSKADAASKLKKAISDKGLTPDDDIISKLTGKASLYFANLITNISGETEVEED